MSFSTDERAALADLLHRLGPDAPTLCEGWNTHDLVSHLWLRENTVVPTAGMFVAALSPQLNTAMDRVRQRDYHQLVTSWSHGAAVLNPRRPLDPVFNFTEHFIHHEDVRRANGQTNSRPLPESVEKKMVKLLRAYVALGMAKSPAPITLRPHGHSPITSRKKSREHHCEQPVEVSGPVGDLLLWLFGRDVVNLDFAGATGNIPRAHI